MKVGGKVRQLPRKAAIEPLAFEVSTSRNVNRYVQAQALAVALERAARAARAEAAVAYANLNGSKLTEARRILADAAIEVNGGKK